LPTQRTLQASDVFVGFLCLYLLTASGSLPFGDAAPMWQSAENLVRHGTLAIDMRWPVNAPLGRGGHAYTVAPLLAVLVHVPGAALHAALGAVAPARAESFAAVTSQLGPLFLAALVPALFFRLLGRLGYDRRQAAWATLLLGAGTSIWAYAHCPYSEIVQAACFIVFFGALVGAAERLDRAAFVRLGLAAALLINAKNIFFVCLPGALVLLWVRHRSRPRPLAAALGWAAAGFAPGLVALALYNDARWGGITSSGYEAVTSGFWSHNVLWGLWGQLFSPGKSLFLFSPPLVLALFGIRRFVGRRRDAALAVALTVGPVMLVYARYLFWSGDWSWGPRYLVFAIPALLLPVAELFDGAPRRAVRAGVAIVLATGIAVQLLGNLIRWDYYMSVARQAQHAWLGKADTRGTVLAPYPCYSCFEEVYGDQWLPPFQPILGHWWLLRHRIAGDDWRTAAADAPWTRYTSLTLDIKESYELAGVDWWLMAVPPGRRGPAAAAIILILVLATPLRPWRAALRAKDESG
jgi:hypothetical protein